MILFISWEAHAQSITIIDKVSYKPLSLVSIYNTKGEQKLTTTNKEGRADLSIFGANDLLEISIVGYKKQRFSYKELAERNQPVLMEESNISLDELVISANRWEQDSREIPVQISTIKARDVALQNPQTAADMLAISGDVYIQKSQLGGGSPMIRGFATNRVLIAVDGVRMNTAIFRSGNLQNVISIDPFTLEETEVLFGPGSVMYGSDAIGGVMDFHTITPKFSDNPDFSGSSTLRYASANNEKTGNVNFNIGLKKWAFVTSFTYSDYGDLRMGSDGPDEYLRPTYAERINGEDRILINEDPEVQVPTGFNFYNVMQKVRFKPSENWDMQYSFHYSATSDYPRFDRLIEERGGELRSAEWYYGPQIWSLNQLKIEHSKSQGIYDNARLILGYQFFEESRNDRRFGDDRLRERVETVDVYSMNLDFDKEISAKQSIFYGTEMLFNNVGSTGIRTNIVSGEVSPTSTRYPNGSTWNSYAAYANYRYRPSEKLTFQTGLRYSHIYSLSEFDPEFFDFPFQQAEINTGALNGSIGLAFRPQDTWQINANFSTGFRAPNIDDIGKVFDSEPGAVIVPNPNLSPEYAYNYELSVSKVVGEFLKLDATAYYTHLQDAMVRRTFQLNGQDSIMYDGEMSRVLAIQNAAQARVYGLQLGMEIQPFRNLAISTKYNIQTGEEDDEETGESVPLRHAAPSFGVTRLIYTANRLKIDLYVQYNSEFSFEELAPSEQNKADIYATDENGNPYSPSWYTLNVKASYQLLDELQLNLGVENITDQRYRPYSSGIVAPGRNFIVSIRGTF